MRAAILAVGSELLGTERLDTNSLELTEALERHGVELLRKAVVGDDPGELERVVGELVSAAELVLVTGGLGPTADDLTREAVAAALGRELSESPRSSPTSRPSSPRSACGCRRSTGARRR